MALRMISLFIVLFICCNDFGMCKNSDYNQLNFVHKNVKTMDKVNEPIKVKMQNKYKHEYISDLMKNQGSMYYNHACLDVMKCKNRENIHRVSWRDRSRVKRAANMYPGSSVAIWKRKNRSSKSLQIRRNVNKRQFQLSHSPGIRQQLPKPNIKIIKRSIKTDNFDNNQMTLAPDTEQGSQKTLEHDSILDEVSINEIEISTKNVKHNDDDILTTKLPTDKFIEFSEKENIDMNKVTNLTLMEENKNQSLGQNDGLILNHDKDQTKVESLPKTEVTSEAVNITIDNTGIQVNSSTTASSDKVLDEIINKPLYILNDSLNHTKDNESTNEDINFNKNVSLGYQNTTQEQVSLNETVLSIIHYNIKNLSLAQTELIENSTSLNYQNTTVDQSKDQDILKNNSTQTIISLTTVSPRMETENNSTQNTTSILLETTTLPSKKYKIKQIKPSLEMSQWVKGNLHQLAVISVPYRRCPQGQRNRKGKCVQVY